MELGRWGVFCFTDALTPAQLTEVAQRTEALGYAALWYPEVLCYESFALGSFLLTRTATVIIASGISNIYARDPTAAKQGQHTLASLSGGRFLLGLGVSHVPLVEEARGEHAGLPGCDGSSGGHCTATGGTAPNGAGGLRPPDDRFGG
jgi:alkanesulfonate monooxygenase SsuD/methylene tetrahydromethanopterin reductase-like flavin-dependent oxidoreductase (luciferase family)